MNPDLEFQRLLTRRHFFGTGGVRLGSMALAMLFANRPESAAAITTPRVHPPRAGFPHFAPLATSLIYLHMNGGPSQMDLWDYKPEMKAFYDKDLPDSVRAGQRITTMTSGQSRFPVAPSMFKFAQHGQCGRWVSELLPHTAHFVDDLAIVKSVHTHAINHDPACTFVMTGSEVPGKPSVGSWLSYGLGSESNELPSFVVLTPVWKSNTAAQALFTRMWSSGFLSTRHTGVALRSMGDPVLYLQDPAGVSPSNRRAMLDTLGKLNQAQFELHGDPEIQTRIAQYEMAFRMQTSVPDLVELSSETADTLHRYGPGVSQPGTFASSALLARRMVERGVRVVQILHRGWDHHGNLPRDLRLQCEDTDQPIAALLHDLKSRGLLDTTLVVWGGEFGRTIYSQGALTSTNYGRDHHPKNFCMWMAGGGIRGGVSYGETDDFSYNIVEKPVHVNDLNATLLHCMGIDHTRFSFKSQGLDQRLTGVEPSRVISEVLAHES